MIKNKLDILKKSKAIRQINFSIHSVTQNQNINSLSRTDISEIIALVPQSPFLIAGTILENICYGLDREVTIQEVEEAAKKAYIYDYINSLPNKFNSLISEGGNNLSGGQRQRIAIARIFLRKPKILILDEATSALDNTSEKYIQTEIEKLLDTLTGANATLLAYANKKIEELDDRRKRLSKAIADLSVETLSSQQIELLSGYLDDWEHISFEDKRKAADGLISSISATSDYVKIEWKI